MIMPVSSERESTGSTAPDRKAEAIARTPSGRAGPSRVFRDRAEAGRALADRLAPLVRRPCIVAAFPQGGVAVALPVAERLRAPLTVIYARTLAAPIAPEFAFGALDEDGQIVTDPAASAWLRLPDVELERVKTAVSTEIQRRISRYRAAPLARHLPGATVVLVDDGTASPLTMTAALAYARRHGAAAVIVATPCASGAAADRLRREADELVALAIDERFAAAREYYRDFSAVSDEQVMAMLEQARRRLDPAPSGPPGLLVSLKNPQGRRRAARLLVPTQGGPAPCVVFAHGWQSGKASRRNWATAEELRAAGFAAFLLDFTGHGESEGTLEESTPGQQADDLGAALDTLGGLDEVEGTRIGVVGANSGAAAALRLAARDSRIRALVLRSAAPEGAEGAEEILSRVTVPTLLVVGENDWPTRYANERLLAGLGGPRQLALVPRADHLFADPAALREAIALTVSWFESRLGSSAESP
jgi:predicted phosphoribosyltransferase/pimeloyl-ACP methyl ester carboxylesterase